MTTEPMTTEAPSHPKPLEEKIEANAAMDEHQACDLDDESCGCPPSHRRMQRVLFSVVGALLIALLLLGIYVRMTS